VPVPADRADLTPLPLDVPESAPRNGAPATGSLLERWIGRPAAAWRVDDLVRVFAERELRLLCLMHVGGDGELKTLDFAPRDPEHLRRILELGERADGSSLFPGLGITTGASDVVLLPRHSTTFVDPFSPLPTLAVLCGHAGRDGAPLAQSPDTVVHRAAARVEEETGCALHALGEVEYFLCRRANGGDDRGGDDRGYHATAPFVFGEALRRRALGVLQEIGVPVKYGHSEVGFVPAGDGGHEVWEQHEIELNLAPLPAAADAVVLTRWVLRRLAQAEGMQVSFDPVLRRGHAGTGLHVHFAPVVDGERRPVRAPGGGALTDPARWLIVGLVRYGTALMAFGNRTESSFVRLGQALEAPRGVVWGDSDRSALVRLPFVPRDAEGRPALPETVEFRLPDGSAHTHLLLAGVAQAMCEGRATPDLDRWIEATAASPAAGAGTEAGAGTSGQGLPRNFGQVAGALGAARRVLEAGGVFPNAMLERLIARLAG
jgi:glutamine synthetase